MELAFLASILAFCVLRRLRALRMRTSSRYLRTFLRSLSTLRNILACVLLCVACVNKKPACYCKQLTARCRNQVKLEIAAQGVAQCKVSATRVVADAALRRIG